MHKNDHLHVVNYLIVSKHEEKTTHFEEKQFWNLGEITTASFT